MDRPISPPPTKRRKVSEAGHVSDRTSPSSRSDLTIYSWNINGIGPFVQRSITAFYRPAKTDKQQPSDSEQRTSLRAVLRRYRWPTILLLQEVKINPDDKQTQAAIEKSLRPRGSDPMDEPSYIAHFCLPLDKYNARGFGRKLYGVCSIIQQDFYDKHVERVRHVSWDSEGRFLVCETKSEGSMPKLAIINVYAVNGTDAPYKNPVTGEIAGTRHDRKLRVHAELQAECHELEANGFAVVIAGDLNIARSSLDGHPNLRTVPVQHCLNRKDFEMRFFDELKNSDDLSASTENDQGILQRSRNSDGLGMIDTFRELYPHRAGYTYYPRGVKFGSSCDRVDMIMVSRSIRSCLADAGICETSADRGPSDHVPLFATLKFHTPFPESRSTSNRIG